MPEPHPTDHRSRFAAVRRERMRKRLIESAMVVFAEKGITSSAIPDVVATAEVSQGSFYNYFRTNEELLRAVAEELSNEIMRMIELVVHGIDDPALRIAIAIRSYLHLVSTHLIVAKFLVSAGLHLAGEGSMAYEYLPRDLKEAQRQNSFEQGSLDVALDVIAGAGLMAIVRISAGNASKDYPERIAKSILCALGVSNVVADQLISMNLPELTPPPDSLFIRAQNRQAVGAAKQSKPSSAASSNTSRPRKASSSA